MSELPPRPKDRAYVSQAHLRFDNFTCIVDLFGVRETDKKDTRYYTADKKKVRQVYVDEDNKLHEETSLFRGREDEEGNVTLLDPNEIVKAKQSPLPKNVAQFTVHKRAEIAHKLFPSPNQGYLLYPCVRDKKKFKKDPENDLFYEMLNMAVRDQTLAFVTNMNLNNHHGVFKLEIYRGWLILQRQLFPQEIRPFKPYRLTAAASDRQLIKERFRSRAEGFNPDAYNNIIAQRLSQVPELDSAQAVEYIEPVRPARSIEELLLV